MKRFFGLVFLFLIAAFSLSAQDAEEGKKMQNNGFLINASYGFNLPLADLADDFGIHSDLSFGVDYVFHRFIFGLESNFIFGNKVKNDVLFKLRDENGGIITNNFELGTARMNERGMYLGVLAGRIIPLSKKNTRSGVRLSLGTGFLQHRIKIVDPNEAIPQIQGEYSKGYDHLTNGWGIKQFVGYHHLSLNGRINFFVGVEATQAFTQNRRDFNFDTLMKDDRQRLDSYVGFRVGWTLPIYTDYGEEVFYY